MKIITTFTLLSLSMNLFAGPFRDKIRERWLNREMQGEAPKLTENLRAIKVGDKDRYYIINVPKSYDKTKATPLLLALHGGGGNMEIQAADRFYKVLSKSEKEGFIALFPNGYSKFPSGKFATWNAGNCCGDASDLNSDDVGFIKALIQEVSAKYNIDSKRIYSIGMSNGAMMSYRLACELSDVITGIGAVAGTDNTTTCTPKNPVSVIHIHAKDDTHVLFNGGAGEDAFQDKTKVTNFISVPSTIEKWVKFNECNPKPKRVLASSGAYCDQYLECKNNVSVKLCVTEKGGHSWPGGMKPRGVGPRPTDAISATDTIWSFFTEQGH
ncbi:alpha/beta hydrolase family esterase [Peredibacter sp. HCB2-198]|uniref:alpha/beta hydrolase family esterase n=1 Tax=Peredibacter sp. HCB2-198 TaxID=3383025 RepID=UPI0038B65946